MSSKRASFLGSALVFWISGGCAPAASSNIAAPVIIPLPAPAPEPALRAAEPPSEPSSSEEDSPVSISASDPIWGSRNAFVTIVFFGDYQCPFTGRSVVTIHALKEKYGPDVLRVVWKNEPLPFHPNAKPAAEAAESVLMLGGNDAFWSFYESAFRNQQRLSPEAYQEWAQAAGVDPASFNRLVQAHAGQSKVDRDHALAQRVKVVGTPGFFINGVRLSGAQQFDKFVAVVDGELERAKASVESGTPPDRVYTVMSTANFKESEPLADTRDDTTTVWKIPIGTSPVRGKATALVTIVEFGDFQCPYCKREEPVLDQIRQTYGDAVRIVWKDEPLPFHPRALPAAELALEARAEKGDAGFWAAHDALFASQPKLEDADLDSVARTLGLDVARVEAAIRTQKYKAKLDTDIALATSQMATGTPHFFINGRRLVGAQPFDKFRPIIDEELVHARDKLAKGTAPSGLYDALTKDGRAPKTTP